MSMRIALIAVLVCSIMTPPLGGIVFNMLDDADDRSGPLDPTPPMSGLRSPSVYLVPSLYEHVYCQPFIRLVWWGIDGPDGSGVDHFDVQYRYYRTDSYSSLMPNFGGWIDLLTDTTMMHTEFAVEPDHVYSFRARAVDGSGNVEEWPEDDDSKTFVVQVPFDIYELLSGAIDRVEEVGSADGGPVSRVLPMPPILIPECYYGSGDGTTVLYPDEDISGLVPSYCGSMEISWIGRDPIGRGDLVFDVQYLRVFMERICYDDEGEFLMDGRPASTGWTDWTTGTNLTSRTFSPDGSGLYLFRCRACDADGNVERYPLTADARTLVLPIHYIA